MGHQPKPWVVDIAWAGLILALFILQGLYPLATSEPQWAKFPEIPPAEPMAWPANLKSYADRGNRPRSRDDSRPRERVRVASDTVTSAWLRSQGWPEWKADGFVRDRQRWGGVDSALALRWDTRHEWDWVLYPPSPVDVNAVPEEILYAHPLWKSAQVRALHRFRSRVRPLRSWTEVFALAPFDSVQMHQIPNYFYVGN